MDDRQRKIEIGAGLQESRLNQDFIHWLNKYGTAVLTVVLIVVGLYAASVQYGRWRDGKVDSAFEQYAAARGALGSDGVLLGSPDALLQTAREHRGQASVSELATLDAASIYLGAAVRGLRPGTNLIDIKPEDALTPEQITDMLKQAATLYDEVADRTRADRSRAVLYHQATLGAAAAWVSLGDFDQASSLLSSVVESAEKANFPATAAEARKRLADLPSLKTPVTLARAADLPPEPADAPPSGLQVEQMPEGFDPFKEGIPLEVEPTTVKPADGSSPPATPPQP